MIQASFTDLVGTTAVPAHAFDIAELTDLTPALDTAQAAHDTAEQASDAGSSASYGSACEHGTSVEASEASPTYAAGCYM